jgi:dihydrofolate synthase/folylpolyglutamate synthase
MEVAVIKQQLIQHLLHTTNFNATLLDVKDTIKALSLIPSYPIILIAGTNGKGSTCAYLSTILIQGGYKVGTFTSPHVFDYNERITINNQTLSDEELNYYLKQVIHHSQVNLGIFKTFTVAAHLAFNAAKVDIAICECGIGGSNDCTNLFEPSVAAITTVALDHCHILGDTIEQIALEKAGIYRRGKPALFGSLEVPQSLRNYATKIKAYFSSYGNEFKVKRNHLSWDYYSQDNNYYTLPYPNLRGAEQIDNAALALACLGKLQAQFPLSLNQIKEGLLHTSLIGRFQVLPGQPHIIMDTAHNPQAVEALVQNMLKLPFAPNSYALFASAQDKDWQTIVKIAAKHFAGWYIAPLGSERSLDVKQLSAHLSFCGISQITIGNSLEHSFNTAIAKLNDQDRLVCFGSFLVVEAALKALQRKVTP